MPFCSASKKTIKHHHMAVFLQHQKTINKTPSGRFAYSIKQPSKTKHHRAVVFLHKKPSKITISPGALSLMCLMVLWVSDRFCFNRSRLRGRNDAFSGARGPEFDHFDVFFLPKVFIFMMLCARAVILTFAAKSHHFDYVRLHKSGHFKVPGVFAASGGSKVNR